MKSRQLLVCLAFLMLYPVVSWAQEQADNTFSVNLNTMTRGELRYGGFSEADENNEGHSNFVLGRYRLTTDYSR